MSSTAHAQNSCVSRANYAQPVPMNGQHRRLGGSKHPNAHATGQLFITTAAEKKDDTATKLLQLPQ